MQFMQYGKHTCNSASLGLWPESTRSTKISFLEGIAKCRHLNKLTCKGNLRQVFICLRSKAPYPLPLHTVYVYKLYLFTQGRGEG